MHHDLGTEQRLTQAKRKVRGGHKRTIWVRLWGNKGRGATKHKHPGIPELELVTAHNDMVMNTWNFSVTSRIVAHGDCYLLLTKPL